MLIFIQIIICPLAVSILSSPIWRQVTTNDTGTGGLRFNIEDSDHYTETERGKIQLLRESLDDVLVKDYQRSDDFLIRWLREFGMNIKSANRSLRHVLKWRAENQMDLILNNTTPSIMKEQRRCVVEGFHKRGGPITYFKATGLNIRDILLNGLSHELLYHFHISSERFLQASINHYGNSGKHVSVTPGVAIIDVRGALLKQQACLRCVEFYGQAIIQNNMFYPRISKLIVIINAPSFGRKVLEMLWPFLSQHHKETIRVFGTDHQEWTKFLLTVIAEDQLLQEYGGTNKLKA